MDPINDKPFSHYAEGILFECDRCDFRGPIKVSKWGALDILREQSPK